MDLSSTTVYLQQCQSYEEERLTEVFARTVSPCLAGLNLRSHKVLLKPNLITAKMGLLACTEGRFILAAAKWFLDHGADVRIGDSPAFGTTRSVLQKIGIGDDIEKMPVRISNFSQVKQLPLASGIPAGLAADALECDLLVNLPRVKAHAQMRVSLGVKNLLRNTKRNGTGFFIYCP